MSAADSSPQDLSDELFLARFADLTLPPALFDHRGHIRLAWLHLQRFPLAEATDRVCNGIRAFAAHLGAAQKYHHTLTEAIVRILHARSAADPAVSFEAFLAANPDLVRDARGLIHRHYSDNLLASPGAREAFVAPDRDPLPSRG